MPDLDLISRLVLCQYRGLFLFIVLASALKARVLHIRQQMTVKALKALTAEFLLERPAPAPLLAPDPASIRAGSASQLDVAGQEAQIAPTDSGDELVLVY